MKATIAALDPDERRATRRCAHSRDSADCRALPRPRAYCLFVAALPEEPPTVELFDLAFESKKIVLCPRVDRRGRRLSIHRITDPNSELVPGILGIPEPRAGAARGGPAAVDWALVPGLAFDERGFRLGRGAGYYDRLLPSLRPDATCWSICLTCQLVRELPVEPHDAPVDGISTPEREVRGVRGGGGCGGIGA